MHVYIDALESSASAGSTGDRTRPDDRRNPEGKLFDILEGRGTSGNAK